MRRSAFLLSILALVASGCVRTPAAEVEPLGAAPTSALKPFAPVVDLAARIEAAVESGEAVRIPAMQENDPRGRGTLAPPRDLEVVLQPSQVLPAEAWAEIDGQRVPFPEVRAYEGHVKGHEDQPVRLTLTDEWARGLVRIGDVQHLVRIGLDGNLPYGVLLADEREDAAAAAAAEGRGFRPVPAGLTYDLAGQEPEDCLRLVPPDVTPMLDPLGTAATAAPLVARLVLDADAQYVDALGPHAFPMMVAFLNEVDAIYEYEVGIRFQLVGVHAHTDPEAFPDPADAAPLANLAEYWTPRADVKRDAVHVFTGQSSSYAQASCIGGAGKPEIAYTFTPLNWARDYAVFHEQAFAHELGHIFSAHHHYGNHVEANGGTGLATIMIQGYTPGAKPVFSTLSKSVIRGWAESHLGQHDGMGHDLPRA